MNIPIQIVLARGVGQDPGNGCRWSDRFRIATDPPTPRLQPARPPRADIRSTGTAGLHPWVSFPPLSASRRFLKPLGPDRTYRYVGASEKCRSRVETLLWQDGRAGGSPGQTAWLPGCLDQYFHMRQRMTSNSINQHSHIERSTCCGSRLPDCPRSGRATSYSPC